MLINCLTFNLIAKNNNKFLMLINLIKLIGKSSRRINFYQLCTANNIHKKDSKIVPIQSLADLIAEKRFVDTPNFDNPPSDPCQFFLNVIRAIKQNLFYVPQIEQKMIMQIQKRIHDIKHARILINIILPLGHVFPRLNQSYKDIALFFLLSKPQLTNKEEYPFIILDNIEKLIFDKRSLWTDSHWVIKDYTKQQKIVNLLLEGLFKIEPIFDIENMLKLTLVCRSLGIKNYNLASYLLSQLCQPNSRLNMNEILTILLYLSDLDIFPHEYFYKNKRKFMANIQSYSKFSTKKTQESLKFLQILNQENPMFCQQIIKRALDVIIQSIPSLDNQDIATLWLLCSKLKFAVDSSLIEKTLAKIYQSINNMETHQYRLLIRGFSRFKQISVYRTEIKTVLGKIKQKMDPQIQYEHQIIRLIVDNIQKEQRQQIYEKNIHGIQF